MQELQRQIRFLIVCLLAGFAPASGYAQDDELLDPEQAFAFSAALRDATTIEAIWDIAPDYYMYKQRLGFASRDADVTLGAPQYPPATMKNDEFFGAMETYSGTVRILVPIVSMSSSQATFTLTASGQGCNEPIGVCYSPLTQAVELALLTESESTAQSVVPLQSDFAGAVVPAQSSATPSAIGELRNLLGIGNDAPQFLDPDDAFRLDVLAVASNRLQARFSIAEGYYLYRDKTLFETLDGNARLSKYQFPPGQQKDDPYFGAMVVYHDGFDVDLPLVRSVSPNAAITVRAEYQGCAEQGICYPPITKTFAIPLPDFIASALAAEPNSNSVAPAVTAVSLSAFLVSVAAAFGAGLLLTFTPCVLPMIPILSSVIVGQSGVATKLRGGSLALVYVLGTAVSYTAIGVMAGATGDQLQAYFQNVWGIGAVSIILVLMALSMFGLFEIQMPSFVQSRLQDRTQGLAGGRLGMVFVLGLISALIVGACVSPILVSALSIAIVAGDPILGGAIMFSMALGMGVVLIALGFGAHILVPNSGIWMQRVKQAFGILLLAVAIYLLGILPAVPVLLLWAALLIITAVYLGATQALPDGAAGWRYFAKGIGTVLLVWGVLGLVGGLAGNRDILNPLPQLAATWVAKSDSTGGDSNKPERFLAVASLAELHSALVNARNAGKPTILDYYADWCIDCKRMETNTFSDPEVAAEMSRFALLQVDVTNPNDAERRALKQRFDVFGPPAMLFFDRHGQEQTSRRLYGFRTAAEFLGILRGI